MSDFTGSLSNIKLKERLETALNKSKPFKNFKWIIDNSGDYREDWFDFKQKCYIEHIQRQADRCKDYEDVES